jgi:hypothetical protein
MFSEIIKKYRNEEMRYEEKENICEETENFLRNEKRNKKELESEAQQKWKNSNSKKNNLEEFTDKFEDTKF